MPRALTRICLACAAAVAMAGGPAGLEAQTAGGSRFGVGFQSSWPAYGLSALYDVNDRVTAQAVLGALGTVTTASGRLLYHFNRQPKYSPFGFGTVGLWRYDYDVLGDDESESTVGLGGDAGIELDWAGIVDDGNADAASLRSTRPSTSASPLPASMPTTGRRSPTGWGCTTASDGSVTAGD